MRQSVTEGRLRFMTGFTLYSYILLWVLLVLDTVILIAVLRQIGVLMLRIGPRPALNLTQMGPREGEPAPFLPADLDGKPVTFRSEAEAGSVIVFTSPGCGSCSFIPPALSTAAKAWGQIEFSVIVSEPADVVAEYRHRFPERVKVVADASQMVRMSYNVTNVPYAVFIDASGIVRLKGVVNDREQIEDLILRGISINNRYVTCGEQDQKTMGERNGVSSRVQESHQ